MARENADEAAHLHIHPTTSDLDPPVSFLVMQHVNGVAGTAIAGSAVHVYDTADTDV